MYQAREEFEQHRRQVTELYETLYAEIHAMRLALIENPRMCDLEEFVDIGWSMLQCEKVLDELRKRYTEIREKTLQPIVCLQYIDETINQEKAGPIRGKLATGTPHTGEMHKTPKSKSPEFFELMRELGVPRGNESVFRIHWPTLVELVTERKSKGLPIPEVLANSKKTYPVYSVRYLTKIQNKD